MNRTPNLNTANRFHTLPTQEKTMNRTSIATLIISLFAVVLLSGCASPLIQTAWNLSAVYAAEANAVPRPSLIEDQDLVAYEMGFPPSAAVMIRPQKAIQQPFLADRAALAEYQMTMPFLPPMTADSQGPVPLQIDDLQELADYQMSISHP